MKPGGEPESGSDTSAGSFRFVSRWPLPVRPERVWETFEAVVDDPDPFVWWPGLKVLERTPEEIRVRTRSRLGYRLEFWLHGLWTHPPDRLGFSTDGDLAGRAEVSLLGTDATTTAVIDWTAQVTRPWMRRLLPVLRPAYVVAHEDLMHRGHRGLRRFLDA